MTDELKPVERVADGVPVIFGPLDDGEQFAIATSLPMSDESHRLAVLSIIEGPAQRGSDFLGGVLSISDYIVHPVSVTNEETGETFTAARLLLLQPDGPPIEFVSAGVLRSLNRLVKVIGRLPPYEPPIKAKLLQQSTRKGYRTYKLQPIAPE